MKEIQEAMIAGGVSPHELAEFKVKLAGEYSFIAGTLEEILARKPARWNAMRGNHKSDKATDREYEATQDGVQEVVLRMRLKSIEKLMSAISSQLRVAEGEAKNQY